MLKKFSKVVHIIKTIVIIILLSIPFILLCLYLRKQNKTFTIIPKFEIIEIKNSDDETYDKESSKNAVRIGKEILEKIKKVQNED